MHIRKASAAWNGGLGDRANPGPAGEEGVSGARELHSSRIGNFYNLVTSVSPPPDLAQIELLGWVQDQLGGITKMPLGTTLTPDAVNKLVNILKGCPPEDKFLAKRAGMDKVLFPG